MTKTPLCRIPSTRRPALRYGWKEAGLSWWTEIRFAYVSIRTIMITIVCRLMFESGMWRKYRGAEILNPFSDLTGDYDSHIRNSPYSQGCLGYALSISAAMVCSSPPTSPYRNNTLWDAAGLSWSVPFSSSHVNANGVMVGRPSTYVNGSTIGHRRMPLCMGRGRISCYELHYMQRETGYKWERKEPYSTGF